MNSCLEALIFKELSCVFEMSFDPFVFICSQIMWFAISNPAHMKICRMEFAATAYFLCRYI